MAKWAAFLFLFFVAQLGANPVRGWWTPGALGQGDKIPYRLERLLNLEEDLSLKIFGQPEAIRTTSHALICYKAGLNDPNQPIASLLYAGPTGVGKTLLATELSKLVLEQEDKLIRLNMSEFALDESLNSLIGVPYGYKESERGGRLSNAILDNPYSIVLLDEIEKASPKVRMLFLSIFDEGQFYDAKGRLVDCRNCLFILTTNIGSQTILNMPSESVDEISQAIEPLLIKHLTPEFYNRLELVIFRSLTSDALNHIIDSKLNLLIERVKETRKVKLSFDESVKEFLSSKGYHSQLGARPLNRLIKYEVYLPIAQALVKKEGFKEGDTIRVFYDGKSCVIKKVLTGSHAPVANRLHQSRG